MGPGLVQVTLRKGEKTEQVVDAPHATWCHGALAWEQGIIPRGRCFGIVSNHRHPRQTGLGSHGDKRRDGRRREDSLPGLLGQAKPVCKSGDSCDARYDRRSKRMFEGRARGGCPLGLQKALKILAALIEVSDLELHQRPRAEETWIAGQQREAPIIEGPSPGEITPEPTYDLVGPEGAGKPKAISEPLGDRQTGFSVEPRDLEVANGPEDQGREKAVRGLAQRVIYLLRQLKEAWALLKAFPELEVVPVNRNCSGQRLHLQPRVPAALRDLKGRCPGLLSLFVVSFVNAKGCTVEGLQPSGLERVRQSQIESTVDEVPSASQLSGQVWHRRLCDHYGVGRIARVRVVAEGLC